MEFHKIFSVKLKDYFFFNLDLIKKTLRFYYLFVIFAAIVIGLYVNDFDFSNAKTYTSTLIFLLAGVLVISLYFFSTVYRFSRRNYLPMKEYFEKMELIINDEGVKQVSEGAECFIKWEDLLRIDEKRSCYKVLVSEREGILIPKRNFNEEEIKTLSEIFNTHKK